MAQCIGSKIKYFRMKKNMTLEELAEGIVSISYLSKIERNGVDSNAKIIKMLCDRLGIHPESIADSEVERLAWKWFKQLLNEDLFAAHHTYMHIENQMEKLIDAKLNWLVEIHELYYFILSNQKQKAKKKYAYLEHAAPHFDELELFYWLKFSALYGKMNANYNLSFDLLLQAEQKIPISIANHQEELNDIYQKIALVALELYYTYHATVYAEKALAYYQNTYQLKRCAICHIIIAVGYHRMHDSKDALESFHFAKKIANNHNYTDILIDCDLQIGHYYLKKEETKEAIIYYMSSYQLSESRLTRAELEAAIGLMKSYFLQNQLDEAKVWYHRANDLVEKLEKETLYLVYEVKVYYYLIYGFDESFEELMIKEVLPYIEEREMYVFSVVYYRITADYYYQMRKYKVAADYYRQINKSLDEIMKRDNY